MLMALTACGAQRPRAGIVEASEFRLLDGWRMRARLAMEGGAPVFALLDGAGRPALRSELDAKGMPRITLFSNEPAARPIAVLEGDDKGVHVLFHGTGAQQSYLFQKNDGTAGLVFTSAAGAHRAEVKLDASGTVDISLFDDAGKPTFEVAVSPDGRIRQSSAQP
jgi:hypothetical protein